MARIAGRLGELRLDTDLDVSHGIVRYLELIKLAALAERAPARGVEETLADVNARLLAAMTPLQREIYESSPLDALLAGADRTEAGDARGAQGGGGTRGAEAPAARVLPAALGPRGEPSLEAFLPRRGEGLALSASDVETYRGCPLRYKFSRVLRIPTEQTRNQRFGIVVHQVLERYHSAEEQTLGLMMELLETAWRRSGLGEGEEERRLRVMARAALVRYHERLREERARPLWFERSFAFDLGAHRVRGRVDRVDALPDGSYELIDYKTGHARTAAELRDDIQLSLYAIAAREAWQLEAHGRPTTTCWTTAGCRCRARRAARSGCARRCCVSARGSSRRTSSRRPRRRSARSATTASCAPRRSGRGSSRRSRRPVSEARRATVTAPMAPAVL